MAAKKKKQYSERHLKRVITGLIKKHKQVRMVFEDADFMPPCDCLCKSCRDIARANGEPSKPELRRRILDNYGNCDVSYKGVEYTKWSEYSESCFLDNYHWNDDVDTYTVKNTLKYMFDHDRHEWTPVLIEYGKRFNRKLKLK